MYHFCTYFDSNYLLRGLALYRSLSRHCESFSFYPLCLDEEAYRTVQGLGLKNVFPVSLTELEGWEKGLAAAKQNRSRIEYYFTLSPILPSYLLEKFGMEIITYLDSDLLFYGSPDPIYDELGDKSILITRHGFPESQRFKEKYGKFNIQYQSFRNDEQGRKCLSRWREQCLEWCYDKLEETRFADQKYLDEWPGLYDRLVVSNNPGVGVAPWNLSERHLEYKDKMPMISGIEVVFYHFHGLKILNSHVLYHGTKDYGVTMDRGIKQLYEDYLLEMVAMAEELSIKEKLIAKQEIRNKTGSVRFLKWLLKGNIIFC